MTKMKKILTLAGLALSLCAAAQTTYTNPVYNADFPDPSVQRGQDGLWYAYATGQRGLRSQNLYQWTKIDNVIARPTWNDSTYVKDGEKKTDYYSFWACDVSYADGQYLMLYACALWDNVTRTGIGVATGSSPTHFTDRGKMFRSTEIGVSNSIDPCYVEEFDKKYIVWGSFHDIYISELTDDGLAVKNPRAKTKIGGGAFEGAMIHKRGNYYYLFASVGLCCEGFNSTYRTVVGRSTKLTGPYLNRQGGTMFDNNYTTIIQGNDRWKGPGHNSEIVTDDEGTDWLLYHAYDTKGSSSNRVLVLDRITWDRDGWPTVNDGSPSSTAQEAPVFYSGDGSVRTYRITNADLAKSQWKGWQTQTEGDIAIGTGEGTAFMPSGYARGEGSFDVSQTLTNMSNGLYELQLNAFDTEDHTDICLNGLPTAVFDSTYTGTYPLSANTVSSNFLRGNFERKAYGLVHDGKLTLQMRSRQPFTADERFAVGNLRLVFRDQNEQVMTTVGNQYASMLSSLYASGKPFYNALRTSADKALEDYTSATATARYSRLVALAKAADNVQASIDVYDSLASHIDLLRQQITEAREQGYATEEATVTLTEAEGVVASQDQTNANVLKLIARMVSAGEAMPYSYQQGDGTEQNPYVVSRPEQLVNMRNVLQRSQTVYFVLEADLDMEGFPWEPLTTSTTQRYFINLDGRGHLVRNLHIESDGNFPSFFGILAGECRNVGFVDADVKGTASGAAIIAASVGMTTYKDEAGNALPCIIENCYATGRVEGRDFASAIAGAIANSPVIVRNVYANAQVVVTGTTASNYGASLVGRIRSALTIEQSYAAGTVEGPVSAPIAAGGQVSTTPAATYSSVIAWNERVDGSRTAEPFAVTAENDALTLTSHFQEMLVNGEPVENGLSHAQLQAQAATWGAPWHSDPAAGNGYPILQWQYARGDYRQMCGFPIQDGLERTTDNRQQTTDGPIYDLTGRRVGHPSRGLYIVGGRKVIVK